MPAGSPIGSGQGVLNRNNIVLCLELLKQNDLSYPVIVDAGVGCASDVSIAMELGARRRPPQHRHRPRQGPGSHGLRDAPATLSGRQSSLAGRIPKRLYASASSPWEGTISYIPGE